MAGVAAFAPRLTRRWPAEVGAVGREDPAGLKRLWQVGGAASSAEAGRHDRVRQCLIEFNGHLAVAGSRVRGRLRVSTWDYFRPDVSGRGVGGGW
ncbi:hypothetical protein [Dactylosporangium sp. CA-233914]|uniref:hypothetical protein n=1 Tax=Dactylosporangium sp. CA-233914 TaxID=3239934 RepID=UPI003D8E13C0